jgi:hypothetical protein
LKNLWIICHIDLSSIALSKFEVAHSSQMKSHEII